MTKRQLQKQARHVLGGSAVVQVYLAPSEDWTATVTSKTLSLSSHGHSGRGLATAHLNATLEAMDVAGWNWRAW